MTRHANIQPAPTSAQLHDSFFALCSALEGQYFFFGFLTSNLKVSHTDVPIRVIANNDIPQAPSPVLLQATLPEFGGGIGGHAFPTVDTPASMTTDAPAATTSDTPASTTAELGHSPISPLVPVDVNLPIETTSDDTLDHNYFTGFRFTDTNDVDNSPPARSSSPGLPCIVSPVHLATCFCNPDNGVMGMGIRCWSCNTYNAIAVPASSPSCEVCLFLFSTYLGYSFGL
jgi:hypothetical protein